MAYTIVNPKESDFSSGKISVKTPIAQGLLKKHVGDVVEIHVPAGLLQLRIDKISVMLLSDDMLKRNHNYTLDNSMLLDPVMFTPRIANESSLPINGATA